MISTVVPTAASAVFLITGANRGLGVEHVRQFLQKSKVKVVATARQPAKATELKGLQDQYNDRLTVVELDVADEASIKVKLQLLQATHRLQTLLRDNNASSYYLC